MNQKEFLKEFLKVVQIRITELTDRINKGVICKDDKRLMIRSLETNKLVRLVLLGE